MAGRRVLLGACVLATATMSQLPLAFADEAADTAAARILGEDGLALADAGNCEKAIEKLDRADKLHHAATTAGRLGECEIQQGKLVAGTERLHRLIREGLPATAPAIFVDAVARARGVLDQNLPRIAMLRISVKARAGAKVTVSVDGDVLPDAVLDNDRPADPGTHTIRATAPGFISATKAVTLEEGGAKSVSLALEPDPRAVPVRPIETSISATPQEPPRASTSPAPFIVLGIGALGLATGIATGALVAVKSSDLEGSCGANKVCPTDKDSEISSAKTLATVSTVGFVVAGAGLGTGLILLLTRHGESSHASSAKALVPVIGPTYVGLTGGF